MRCGTGYNSWVDQWIFVPFGIPRSNNNPGNIAYDYHPGYTCGKVNVNDWRGKNGWMANIHNKRPWIRTWDIDLCLEMCDNAGSLCSAVVHQRFDGNIDKEDRGEGSGADSYCWFSQEPIYQYAIPTLDAYRRGERPQAERSC